MNSLKRKARFRTPYKLRSTRQRVMKDIGAKQVTSLSYHSSSNPIETIGEQIAYLRRLALCEADLNSMMLELKNNTCN